MKLKIFTKKDCPRCPEAEKIAKKMPEKISTEFFDVEEADGLAEAQFYSIMATPSLILCDNNENELASWRGETPSEEIIKETLQNNNLDH